MHFLLLVLEPGGVADLLEDAAGLLGLELCDLDLPLDVLLFLDEAHVLVLLFDELLGVVHFLALLRLELSELLVLKVDLVPLIRRLNDVVLLLRQRVRLHIHLMVEAHRVVKRIRQLLLDPVQRLHSGARLKLQLKQRLVAVVDVLNELFVFNLKLMEVNELKIVTHLVFVLNLGLGFKNLALERVVFALEFVDQLLLLLEFIKHVLRQFLGVVLANATVLRRGQETAEVERLLPNLSNTQIRALKNGLQPLQKRFRLVTALLDVSL